MRITRSTLNRLIAEESARLLREGAFPEEIEGVYGEAPPEDGGGDGIPKMLHVMYRGFRPVFIVTDVDANPLGEEAEDVTEQIAPAESNPSTPELANAIIDFITDETNNIMYVFDEEMNDSETDEKFETEDYVEHLESLIASGEEEAATRGAEMYMRAGMSGEDEDLHEAKSEEEEEEDDDYFGDDDPFGDDEAIEKGYELDPTTLGYKKPQGPEDDYFGDDDPFGDDEALAMGYELDPATLGYKKPGKGHRTNESKARKGSPGDSFLDYNPEDIPDMDDQYDPDYYEGLEDEEADDSWADYDQDEDDVPYGRDDVAGRQGRGHRTDEGEDKTDPYERGQGTYGKGPRREEIGLTSMSMIWDPTGEVGLVKNPAQADDINYSADLQLGDQDRTHPIHQTILGKPGFRPVAELFLDLEYGKSAMDTKVKATIETDEGQTYVGTGRTAVAAIKKAEGQWRETSSVGGQSIRDLQEYGDPDDADPDGGPGPGFMASDEEMDRQRRGDVYIYGTGPYDDVDDRDVPLEANPYTRGRVKYPYPVDDDIDGPDAREDSDNLSEARWAKLAGILKG